MTSQKEHWETVYASKNPSDLSWYQAVPTVSLELIRAIKAPHDAPIIDIGGGASVLVDHLLKDGFSDISVLDIANAALNQAQKRLETRAAQVSWLEANILEAELPVRHYQIWHDRAVFHFLTEPKDQERYVAQLERSIAPGGHVIMATFALDGPTRCSGLSICQYDTSSLQKIFGSSFIFEDSRLETHQTPNGAEQYFQYVVFRAR
jgi:2-polyprenyl-3-methyl-5-hydroxy-6-metoxy-1,4-benzoquinol methylase